MQMTKAPPAAPTPMPTLAPKLGALVAGDVKVGTEDEVATGDEVEVGLGAAGDCDGLEEALTELEDMMLDVEENDGAFPRPATKL